MEQEKDELRYRFTAWLEVVVKRAKIDYIRQLRRRVKEISLDSDSLTNKLVYEQQEIHSDEFDFDNGKLSRLFEKLSSSKKRVLILLFVHNLEPEEVADKLGCTVQHVYNQRSTALKELRKNMGGNHD